MRKNSYEEGSVRSNQFESFEILAATLLLRPKKVSALDNIIDTSCLNASKLR